MRESICKKGTGLLEQMSRRNKVAYKGLSEKDLERLMNELITEVYPINKNKNTKKHPKRSKDFITK